MKSAIIGCLSALAILLSGCGALRLGYNQAPELAYWWLDAYADFQRDQDPGVRGALDAFFRWHRRTQLGDYAQLLARAQAEVQQPATAAQACRWYDEALARLQPMVQQGVPLLLGTVQTFTPRQFRHIERKYGKRNAEFVADYLQDDPEERTQASVDRAVERLETLYGWLEAAQKEEVRRMVLASPFDPALWLAERKARQQDILQTLRRLAAERPPAAESQAALLALVDRIQRSPRQAYRDYQQRLLQYNCEFAARLHNSTSPAQRMKAVEKLKGWEEDFRALAASARN